jgi:hypothetical protein
MRIGAGLERGAGSTQSALRRLSLCSCLYVIPGGVRGAAGPKFCWRVTRTAESAHFFEETSSDRRKINQLALAIRISPNDKPTLDRIFPNREPLTRDWLCDINCMSDYEEYNEQVLRFRELLTALNAVLDDLAPADLDSWAEMKQRLPLAQPRADDLLMIRQTTEELKRMGDTLIRILVKYE